MFNALRLLCCGRDLSLLTSRQLIFQSAGFTTEISLEITDVEQKLREGGIDLLVLCHSLDKEDWDVVRQAVRKSHFSPILLFLNAGAPKGQLEALEKSYDTCLNPAGLLDLVRKLLLVRQALAEKSSGKGIIRIGGSHKSPRNRSPRSTAIRPHSVD